MAAENYRSSLWNVSLIARNGGGGGAEVETKRALTMTMDSSLAPFARVPEVRQGEGAAAQATAHMKGFSVSHNYYLHTEMSHAFRTKEKKDLVRMFKMTSFVQSGLWTSLTYSSFSPVLFIILAGS